VPDCGWRQVRQALRAESIDVPVIFLTSLCDGTA
jgi:hypothetical protein